MSVMFKNKDIKKLRTWIEVDTRALAHNFRLFRKFIGPKIKLMAVVKSNAYGHGLIETSQVFAKLGADWLGVDSMTEALALRKARIKAPLLVLGYTLSVHFDEAAKQKITLTVSQFETIKELIAWSKKQGKAKLEVHLKVDTGMHRQGFLLGDFDRALTELAKAKRVVVTGLYSHLASPGHERFRSKTVAQGEEFKKFQAVVDVHRLKIQSHLTATGGALAYPEYQFDLVRIGLGMYGLWPTEELMIKMKANLPLRPVLSWKTIVSEVKTLPADGEVGYDFTQAVKARTVLAVCPVGYWHGFARHLSNCGQVLVRGVIAPVVGRVSMDMIVFDASKVSELKVGDEVVLIDSDLTATHVANLINTSAYETITTLNPLIWRFYK